MIKFFLLLVYVMSSGMVDTRTYPGEFDSLEQCEGAADLVAIGALPRPPVDGELKGWICVPMAVEPVDDSAE